MGEGRIRRRKEEQRRERKGKGRRIKAVVVGGKEGREGGWKGQNGRGVNLKEARKPFLHLYFLFGEDQATSLVQLPFSHFVRCHCDHMFPPTGVHATENKQDGVNAASPEKKSKIRQERALSGRRRVGSADQLSLSLSLSRSLSLCADQAEAVQHTYGTQ